MKLSNGHELKLGDRVLFRDIYGLKTLEVGEVLSISPKTFCVGFLQGFSDERRDIEPNEVLALVDETMSVPRIQLDGWSGHFILLLKTNNE